MFCTPPVASCSLHACHPFCVGGPSCPDCGRSPMASRPSSSPSPSGPPSTATTSPARRGSDHAVPRRAPHPLARAMPPCSPRPATTPVRRTVTALAATAFIGACMRRPHTRGRCTPPCPSPHRLSGGKTRVLFLSGSAEPSLASGRGEGLGRRPVTTQSGPVPLPKGGTVRGTAPAAAEQFRHRSHSPPHQPLMPLGWQAGPCLAARGLHHIQGCVAPRPPG